MSIQHKYPAFNEWVWKSFSNMNRVLNLDEFVKTNYEKGRDFHVGTDSQLHGNKTIFATAIVAHNISKGGEAAIHKYKDSMPYPSLRPKLIMEAMRSLEAAWYLDQVLPSDVKIRLHIDVNNDVRFQSGQYKEQLVGMIMSQGYVSYRDIASERKEIDDFQKVVFWKPESWAATSVADRHTKNA